MAVGSGRIRDGEVAEGEIMFLEDFFGHGWRGNDYCGYTAKFETH